jgi:molecular chaperone DnaK
VETLGGVMTTLIPRNSTIPIRKAESFSTAEDNQTAVDMHVLQGERPMAADNMSLGRFRLEGIAPAPRGLPQVEVTFDIDANGIINVSARDKATGKEQRVTITASTNLNMSDIERMVNEANQNQAADQRQRELAETRNTADSTIYQVEKLLNDLGMQVPGEMRGDIEHRISELRQAVATDDANRIRRQTEELQQAANRVGQAAQQPQPETGQPYSGPERSPQDRPEGDVVEGEFHEE